MAQIAGNDVEAKFCAKYPNPPKEAQRKHELQLDTDIRKASVDFRQRVQSDLALINGGVGFGENGKRITCLQSNQLSLAHYCFRHFPSVWQHGIVGPDLHWLLREAQSNRSYTVCRAAFADRGVSNSLPESF